VISIDGMKPDTYLAPDAHGLKVPTLRELVAHGASAEDGMLSVMPAQTYPAHVSIITGVHPARHGITTNLAEDPDDKNLEGWRGYPQHIRVPPIYEVAFRAGLTTAVIEWPATVGARATWLLPEFWRAGTREDVKLVQALSTPGLFERVHARF